jgi:hypothetical protein
MGQDQACILELISDFSYILEKVFQPYFIWPLCMVLYSIKCAWGSKLLAYIRNWPISLAYIRVANIRNPYTQSTGL